MRDVIAFYPICNSLDRIQTSALGISWNGCKADLYRHGSSRFSVSGKPTCTYTGKDRAGSIPL